MFSRNRSAQLLEQPLLSRFAADLRRHTRAFAYKLPHKIHNTSPRRAITTEDIHRSREFRQNRGGDSPADRRFSKQDLHVPPLSSLSQSCIGGASRSLRARSRNLRRLCPQPCTPIAPSLGHTTKSKRNYTRTSEGEASPWLHRRRGPQCGSAASQCYAQFPPHANEEGGARTGNNECAHQSPTKRKEKRAEEEGMSGRFLTFRSEKRGKTGGFCRISGGFRPKIPDFSRSRWERRAPVWPFAGECVILPQLNPPTIFPMKELALKYGCNPNQKPARIYMDNGAALPIEVLGGRPGYINFLDALNGWQLVRELKAATGLPAATSFKHVSPAGAAVGEPLDETLRKIYFCDDLGEPLSPIASAYARARGADRMSSYGDFIALSDECDKATALLIKREVSDGVIAPSFSPEALEILRAKRKGTYCILQIDPNYRPDPIERKQVFGVTFEQGRNEVDLSDPHLFDERPTQNKELPAAALRDLTIALITLKYTQSNSVCYVKGGQAIGIGAGQQSRIHCTRLAGTKADIWWLRQHPQVMSLPFVPGIRRADRDNTIDIYISDDADEVLAEGVWQQFFTERPAPLTREEKKAWIARNTGVSLGSDAFFPFGDNIERAHRSGVCYVAQAGGSVRDDHVIKTCDKYNIAMAFTGVRLFHH